MRVKIIKAQPAYKIGDEYEVTNHDKDYYEYGHQLILKSDCTIIPDEPGNRVSFDYDRWKQKGGKVWYDDREVTSLTHFNAKDDTKYAGLLNGMLTVFRSDELTMSAPDEVYYCNVYNKRMSGGYSSKENAIPNAGNSALHILEINITKGTNKIVHTYNEKV